MRIVRIILLSLILAFCSGEAYCQSTEYKGPTMEDIRQWFLVEGIRVDTYAFADTLESALKPQESNVPAKIQELESRLPHVYITEKRQIAKELVPQLIEMTPMGWHIENKDNVALKEITIDLNILVGSVE